MDWMLYYPLEKYFANHGTDLLLTINSEDFDLAQRKFRCLTGRIHGVGVDAGRYSPCLPEDKTALRTELGLPNSPDTRIILCAGELRPNKNQAMLLRAMPTVVTACPSVHLLLAGNGPEEERLQSMTHTLGLDGHVTFLGYSIRLQDYQKASDLAVSCSIREGLGLNLIEAMLTAHPVVATDNRGHRELVREGETGYLVPVGDVSTLADRILTLIRSPLQMAVMGQAGRVAADRYTYEAVYKELETFYFPFLSDAGGSL